MSVGAIQSEADLTRWLQRELQRPGVITQGGLPGHVLQEGTVSGTKVAPESLQGGGDPSGPPSRIVPESIGGGEGGDIAANTITAVNIEAGSITAEELEVTELSAITGNMGTLTSGLVIGATIKTSEEGRRVEMDDEGLRFYDVEDALKASLDTTTGIATLTAVISSEDGSEIDGEHLNDESVTVKKLNVETLSAITANLGTVTAGTLKAVSIEGGTVKGTTLEAVEGITLGAGEDAVNRLSWYSGEDRTGTIYNPVAAAAATLWLVANPDSTQKYGVVGLEADDEAGLWSTLYVIVDSGGRRVIAQPGAANAVLIYNDERESDFLQLPETAKATVLWGRVSSTGTKQDGSARWTVERVTTGKYKITFSEAFGEVPTLVAASRTSGVYDYRIESESTKAIQILFVNPTGEAAQNAAFSFQVIG